MSVPITIHALLVNTGLYGADIPCHWKTLQKEKPEAVEDMKKMLTILDRIKYLRVDLEMVRAVKELYEIFKKYLLRKSARSYYFPALVLYR